MLLNIFLYYIIAVAVLDSSGILTSNLCVNDIIFTIKSSEEMHGV